MEGKFHQKVVIRRAYEQAADEVTRYRKRFPASSDVPVAVTKDNGKAPLATLDLEHFIDMLKELVEARAAVAQVAAKLVEPRTVEPAESRLVELLKRHPAVLKPLHTHHIDQELVALLSRLGLWVPTV